MKARQSTVAWLFIWGMLLCGVSSAQKKIDLDAKSREIIDDALFLYRLEKAAWESTDLLKAEQKPLIGGYFSYMSDGMIKSIYYNKTNDAVVAGFVFSIIDSMSIKHFNTFEPRPLSNYEATLAKIREEAAVMSAAYYEMFRYPRGIHPNIVIKERTDDFAVYSIPGSETQNLIPIGADCFFTYTKQGKSKKIEFIHNSLIPFEAKSEKKAVGSVHNHTNKKYPFISATDICTLILYRGHIEWDTHEVVTNKYISKFNLRTLELTIQPNTTRRKI